MATDLLVSDLQEMVEQWQPGAENYRASLEAESAENGLRKMLFGMGSLSLGELAGERMKVALEANSTEDEHDCFSDNTHNSHFYNARGIRNVYLGEYKRVDGSTLTGPSLASLVQGVSPEVDSTLKTDLESTEAAAGAGGKRQQRRSLRPADRRRQCRRPGKGAQRDRRTGQADRVHRTGRCCPRHQRPQPDTADHEF